MNKAIDYILDNKEDINKKMFKNNDTISVALIGIGPHAKRIYLNYLKKHHINLALVVELNSKKDVTKKYLTEMGFNHTKLFTIDDSIKDNLHLPSKESNDLLVVCNLLEITHIIVATEPKAHYMYIEFALKNNIHVLSDKPISVNKNMTSIKSINDIKNQYYELLELSKNSSGMCKIMCQRQYHKGYEYVKKLLNDVVKKYNIPITYIDIYHCDGNWEMPHDLNKENHPYKYGYGKLFHSGYHFIDLLSDFLKINMQLGGTKKITKGEVYSNCFTPLDELNVFNIEDYKTIFKNQIIPEFYNDKRNFEFKKYGEKNYYGLMKFTNDYNETITNVNLNLLHYGFSRRGWIQSKDYYKNNGRIRHERINIQVGTLLNIQIHSYQSKEIKDRLDDMALEEQTGGLEHFDIDIYRNVDIIGGKPFERVTLGSLYTEKEKENILGYNELSREVYLSKFLKGNCKKGDIKDQALGIEILSSCALGIHNHYANSEHKEKININDAFNKNINIDDLKSYSNKNNYDDKIKKLIFDKNYQKEGYDVELIGFDINNKWELSLNISIYDEIAPSLLRREFSNKLFYNIYKKHLEYLVKNRTLEKIVKIIKKKN